nr:GNAT family N-acetyltransferase [Cryobacterium sp. BB736]
MVSLRQVRPSDKWTLWEWRNSDRIRHVSTNDAEIPRQHHEAWFSRAHPAMRDRTILVESNGVPVGWFQIENWDDQAKVGSWGIALGDPVRAPAGLGKALPLLAHGHAFDRLEARRLTGRVLAHNAPMRHIMTQLGFVAVSQDETPLARADGGTTTTIIYDVTRESWPDIRENGLRYIPLGIRDDITRVMREGIAE